MTQQERWMVNFDLHVREAKTVQLAYWLLAGYISWSDAVTHNPVHMQDLLASNPPRSSKHPSSILHQLLIHGKIRDI